MQDNQITSAIIGSAIEVHRRLGPGLLESAYKETFYYQLMKDGIPVLKEVPMPLKYDDIFLECGYRIDLLVENKIVIELKSVERLTEVHTAQTLTYMKLGNFRLGLLINFNVALLKDGIKRLIINVDNGG